MQCGKGKPVRKRVLLQICKRYDGEGGEQGGN
jgi:DNA-binding Xre family transcriptional regulator